MRVLSGLFSIILVLFALVQYNDPDFFLWFLIYAISAVLCAIAAIRPQTFSHIGALRGLLALGLIGSAVGTYFLWPAGQAWWTKEVVWDSEAVREGLGMGIVMIGLVLAGLAWWQAGRTSAA